MRSQSLFVAQTQVTSADRHCELRPGLGSEVIRHALQGRWPAGKDTQQGMFRFS